MRRAFTLIELLVVIAIIAILAGLLFPVFAQAKKSAKGTVCLSNLHQLGLAVQTYMGDYDDLYPYCVDASDKYAPQIWNGQPTWAAQIPNMPLLNEVLQPYVKSKEAFHCPVDSGTYTLDNNIGRPFVTAPSMFATYGSSYLMRTEIVFRSISGTGFASPASVNFVFDAAGHWHGDGRGLQPGDDPLTIESLIRIYRYNTLFGDFHAKSISYGQMQQLWAQPIQ